MHGSTIWPGLRWVGVRTMSIEFAELLAFGRQADALQFPSIEPGGFIVPGDGPCRQRSPGKPEAGHARPARAAKPEGRGRQKIRSATGPGQGRSASSRPTSHSAAHAVGRRLSDTLELEELQEYYAPRLLHSSSSFSVLQIPVGIFRTLPYVGSLNFVAESL